MWSCSRQGRDNANLLGRADPEDLAKNHHPGGGRRILIRPVLQLPTFLGEQPRGVLLGLLQHREQNAFEVVQLPNTAVGAIQCGPQRILVIPGGNGPW